MNLKMPMNLPEKEMKSSNIRVNMKDQDIRIQKNKKQPTISTYALYRLHLVLQQ